MGGKSNKQTDKCLLKYSGISSHSLMGVWIGMIDWFDASDFLQVQHKHWF
jgi:hypothetical protein